jgi:hypothetical protein
VNDVAWTLTIDMTFDLHAALLVLVMQRWAGVAPVILCAWPFVANNWLVQQGNMALRTLAVIMQYIFRFSPSG